MKYYQTETGYALQFAFERKINGASEDCRREGIDFVPLAVESFGGWHQVSTREVEKMARALARHTDEEEGEAVRHLWGSCCRGATQQFLATGCQLSHIDGIA